MARTWRWDRPACNLDPSEYRVELRDVVFSCHWMNLELVQIIEEASFTLALTAEDEYIVIDDAACVTVSALRDRPRLKTLDPT